MREGRGGVSRSDRPVGCKSSSASAGKSGRTRQLSKMLTTFSRSRNHMRGTGEYGLRRLGSLSARCGFVLSSAWRVRHVRTDCFQIVANLGDWLTCRSQSEQRVCWPVLCAGCLFPGCSLARRAPVMLLCWPTVSSTTHAVGAPV